MALLPPCPLPIGARVGFVTSPRIGDALIAMVTAHHLRCNGHAVTVFSDVVNALRVWFPQEVILPLPPAARQSDTFAPFGALIYTYPHDAPAGVAAQHPFAMALALSPLFKEKKQLVEIQQEICERVLQLNNVTRANGLEIPDGVRRRRHARRIVLHPTGSQPRRNWVPRRFVALARGLAREGYAPYFVMAPHERAAWAQAAPSEVPIFSSEALDEAARFVCESGWFIGVDSGIGHLASNVGVPTVSLMIRRGVARQWRPGWAPGEIVLPPRWLITRPLKERVWRYGVTVRRVRRAFHDLLNKASDTGRCNSHRSRPLGPSDAHD